jgi:hypothetical protein
MPYPNGRAAPRAFAVAVLSCCTRCPGFRFRLLSCGAMGIRTPDLLPAIQRQPVHPASIAAGHSPRASTPVRPRPGLLRYFPAVLLPYRPIEPATPPNRHVTSQNLPRCYRLRFLHNQASDRGPRVSEAPRHGASHGLSLTVASPGIPLSDIQTHSTPPTPMIPNPANVRLCRNRCVSTGPVDDGHR